jgi:signal peptide peptidase SppA
MNEAHVAEVTAPEASQSKEQTIVLYVLGVILAVVAGYYISTALIPTPKIGIINLQTQVGGVMVEVMSREINYARQARDIKGVVLVINSPGGGAADGHDLYYQIRTLREEKPVVASMDGLAASAAYQIGVGANEIYGKPASLIGNIGVISGQPGPEVLSERFITTGPFKTTGGSATSYMQKLDLLYADFRDSVVAERSKARNPLQLTPDEVATGELWVGVEAKAHGLIDEIGSLLDAVDRAAELAGLRNYELVQVRDEFISTLEGEELTSTLALYAEMKDQPEFDLESQADKYPTFYQLYIPLE